MVKVFLIGLHSLGIQDISAEHCKFLVGIGTDGAAANVAAAGLKGLVEKEVSSLVVLELVLSPSC